mgnify:CR=1 FL=1
MTPIRVSLIGAVAAILLILVVLELVRGRRLKERYALLWLATGAVLLVLSLWRDALNTMAGWLGVTGYPPAVLFAVATASVRGFALMLLIGTVLSMLTAVLATRAMLALVAFELAPQVLVRGRVLGASAGALVGAGVMLALAAAVGI